MSAAGAVSSVQCRFMHGYGTLAKTLFDAPMPTVPRVGEWIDYKDDVWTVEHVRYVIARKRLKHVEVTVRA